MLRFSFVNNNGLLVLCLGLSLIVAWPSQAQRAKRAPGLEKEKAPISPESIVPADERERRGNGAHVVTGNVPKQTGISDQYMRQSRQSKTYADYKPGYQHHDGFFVRMLKGLFPEIYLPDSPYGKRRWERLGAKRRSRWSGTFFYINSLLGLQQQSSLDQKKFTGEHVDVQAKRAYQSMMSGDQSQYIGRDHFILPIMGLQQQSSYDQSNFTGDYLNPADKAAYQGMMSGEQTNFTGNYAGPWPKESVQIKMSAFQSQFIGFPVADYHKRQMESSKRAADFVGGKTAFDLKARNERQKDAAEERSEFVGGAASVDLGAKLEKQQEGAEDRKDFIGGNSAIDLGNRLAEQKETAEKASEFKGGVRYRKAYVRGHDSKSVYRVKPPKNHDPKEKGLWYD
jgi:hypothetical protein